jgi:class 3 adenylate cyclase
MSTLKDELENSVKQIFKEQWSTREGTKVPESEDLKLNNEGVKLKATVLYADLSSSTHLVDNYKPHFAAEIYKSYLHCAAKIIRSEGGVITSYDGDRIMAVFIGNYKNTSAGRSAFKINYAVSKIINPALKNQYPKTNYLIKQVVGIDTSDLWVARTGIRGSNDLVWVGRAANHAAKLSSLPSDFSTYISSEVYNAFDKSMKYSSEGKSMWESRIWTKMGNLSIYASNWYWAI